MVKKVYLILLVLALISIALGGCRRHHSNSAASVASVEPGPGGEDPPDPPEDPPEDPPVVATPPDIWIYEYDLLLTDPNSGNDGVAEPDEEIAFSLIINNLGESPGRVDITDLNVVPAGGLQLLTYLLDGNPVSDLTQIEVPGESAVTLTGTAKVDPLISSSVTMVMGPPTVQASAPPTDPETVIDVAHILGFGTLLIDVDGNPDPPPEEPYHVRMPGSILVFPFYRIYASGGGGKNGAVTQDTMITVTNTNSETKLNPDGIPMGTIDVKISFQDSEDCCPYARWERLTPNDTLSIMVSDYIPYSTTSEGWVYIVAEDTKTGEPVDFDALIGHATYIDSEGYTWTEYNPFAYQGIPGHGLPTDLDFDGNLDLNGQEYSQVSDNQMFPRFIGTDPALGPIRPYFADLIYVNLTGGIYFTSVVDFLIFNDNEQAFSTVKEFDCWESIPLEELGNCFLNDYLKGSNQDPDEDLSLFGYDELETGWFKMSGNSAYSMVKVTDDQAFITLLREWYNGRATVSTAFDNGLKQDNATLWPLSVAGDNED